MMTASCADERAAERLARLVEKDHRAGRRAGHEGAVEIADRSEADIDWVKAVDVLMGRDASSTRDALIVLGSGNWTRMP